MARPRKTELQYAMIKQVGENIRTARVEAGVTQEALALEVGSDADYIRDIEKGRVEPSMTRFVQIAWALGVPPSRLIEGLERAPRGES